MKKLLSLSSALLLLLFTPAALRAADYNWQVLHTFTSAGGQGPLGTLIQGTDGNFYGTTVGQFYDTSVSGNSSAVNGTVFRLSPTGKLTNLWVFAGATGSHPMAPLIQINDDLWGTTSGGFGGNGITVFHVRTNGTGFTTVLRGPAEVGINNATLVRGKDGYLYGTERQNGAGNYGRIFRITPATGAVKVLYSFKGHPDGEFPNGPLVQGTNGILYGCCGGGGGNDEGTIFSITTAGSYKQLHAMAQNGVEGSGPIGLVEAKDGNFYGVAQQGGNENYAPVGTVFRVTTAGKLTKLFDLGSRFGVAPSAPLDPQAALILGPDGALYGTGKEGGDTGTGYGGVFRISTTGGYSSVHGFNGSNGAYPFAGLTLGKDGNFYGVTGGKVAETDDTDGGDQYGKFFKLEKPAADPAADEAADADVDAIDAEDAGTGADSDANAQP